jgi:lipopolysaccharide biosynthesis glycosyltransferase
MVYPLCVAMDSLRRTGTAPFRLTIGYLEGTLSKGDRQFLAAVMGECAIEHDFMPLTSDPRFISQGHISPTTFAKFLLADAQPEAHLWIDADTVGLRGWDELFAHVYAATAKQGLVVAHRGAGADGLAFNAGVLGWPAGKRRQWSTHLSSLDVVDTQEQYLFNMLYAKTASRVSERFNVLTYRVDSLASREPPFILHYAGAHKPWHMPRRFAHLCLQHQCPWSEWFRAESIFLDSITSGQLRADTMRRKQRSLRSGKLRWQRDHSGLIFLRLLQKLGPLGHLIVRALHGAVPIVPRGTHPIH